MEGKCDGQASVSWRVLYHLLWTNHGWFFRRCIHRFILCGGRGVSSTDGRHTLLPNGIIISKFFFLPLRARWFIDDGRKEKWKQKLFCFFFFLVFFFRWPMTAVKGDGRIGFDGHFHIDPVVPTPAPFKVSFIGTRPIFFFRSFSFLFPLRNK